MYFVYKERIKTQEFMSCDELFMNKINDMAVQVSEKVDIFLNTTYHGMHYFLYATIYHSVYLMLWSCGNANSTLSPEGFSVLEIWLTVTKYWHW